MSFAFLIFVTTLLNEAPMDSLLYNTVVSFSLVEHTLEVCAEKCVTPCIYNRIKPVKPAQLCAEVFLNKLPQYYDSALDKALSFMLRDVQSLERCENCVGKLLTRNRDETL